MRTQLLPNNMRLQYLAFATCSGDGGGPRGRKALQGGSPPLSPRTSEPSHGDDYDPVRNPESMERVGPCVGRSQPP